MNGPSHERNFDVAVVGAGIVGLAHAWEAARNGSSVVVFERSPRPMGASIRNFGMILPVGMKPGAMLSRALRSRARWLHLIEKTRIWYRNQGAMILAYHEDEQRALEEFIEWGPQYGYEVSWLSSKQAVDLNPVNEKGLRGALHSKTELLIDPKEAMQVLPEFLADRHKVKFEFGKAVTGISMPHLEAGGKTYKARRLVVCSGADLETLYPQQLASHQPIKCKLQMMQTQPQPASWRLGPFLATGLSLTHYASFAACPSVDEIRGRMQETLPDLVKWGIHVLVAQDAAGSLVIGDSHVYGDRIDPFGRQEIDQLIFNQMTTFLNPPEPIISRRWHGIYVKTESGDPLVLSPEPGVRVVAAVGGGGMTTSFALAEDVFDAWD